MTRTSILFWVMAPLLLAACSEHDGSPRETSVGPSPALDAETRLAQNEGYLPSEGPLPEQSFFLEDWFGNELAAMKEPRWVNAAPMPAKMFKLRILYLPAFVPAHAIRVESQKTGGASVFVVGLEKSDGATAGKVDATEEFTLSADAVAELRALIASAELPNLSFTSAGGGSACGDGLTLVFELIDERGHHMVERHECEIKGQLKILARHVDKYRKTAGANIDEYWSPNR